MIIKSATELKGLADKFIKTLESDSVVLLNGDLGTGKTSFVQEVGRVLGIREKMNSPTFVMLKKYKISRNNKWGHLIHVDAYRLSSQKDLQNIGLLEELSNPRSLIIIEWGNKIKEFLPQSKIREINFQHIAENKREISFQ